jgi:hypothetical protein
MAWKRCSRTPGREFVTKTVVVLLAALFLGPARSAELQVTMVGNAGVLLSDYATSLLIDLPYASGASVYQTYRPDALQPSGTVVSVVTHHHRDHFEPDLFLDHDSWKIIGPPSVGGSIPPERVVHGDSVRIGGFDIVTIPTPHTPDHRSYRIRWGGRVLHIVGDTEDPETLTAGPQRDLLFITPWLSCSATASGVRPLAGRSVAYHMRRSGRDRICGPVEVLDQGASFSIAAR